MAISQIQFYHRELQDWDKSLKFYEEEMQVFNDRLQEVVTKYTHREVLIEVEHFQNQFILQKEQFDLLQHDIHRQETKMAVSIPGESRAINQPVLENQHFLRNKVELAEKIFIDTKHGFYQFLSKVF